MLAEGSLYNLRISPRSFLQPVKRARYVVAAEGGCRFSTTQLSGNVPPL